MSSSNRELSIAREGEARRNGRSQGPSEIPFCPGDMMTPPLHCAALVAARPESAHRLRMTRNAALHVIIGT